MTLNGVMALILRYFSDFVYDVVVKQLLSVSQFHSLLLIIYDRINSNFDLRTGWMGESTLTMAKLAAD